MLEVNFFGTNVIVTATSKIHFCIRSEVISGKNEALLVESH